MTKTIKTTVLVTLLALIAAACATSEEAGAAGPPRVSVICAEETPDCDDTVLIDPDAEPLNEPGDPGPPPPGASSGMLADGGLTVPEALETDATGILAVRGFYLDDGTGPRLCETLAESFPPQCGGASLALGDLAGIDLGELQSSGGTTWSDSPVVILGELVDGILVPTPLSI